MSSGADQPDRGRALATALLLALAACPSSSETTASATADEPPARPQVVDGPSGDASATLEQRQRAVLNLLAGGTPATALPVRATDAGKKLDPTLPRRLSPRVLVRMPARLRVGSIKVEGAMPPEVVTRKVRQHFGPLIRCYKDALKAKPTLKGRITLRFTIVGERATKASADKDTDMPDAKVTRCMLENLRKVRFPNPDNEVTAVTFPLILTPPSGGR